ncbi:MAG: hypothetical protein ACYS9C_06895 [Planctomycetota bacterium]
MDDSFEKKKPARRTSLWVGGSALAKPLDVHSGIAVEHYETRRY